MPSISASGSSEEAESRITAFVSWAHVHRSSEPDDVKRWTKQVYEFVVALRENGIDADVDLFNLHRDGIDWRTYGVEAIQRADYVVIVASEAYRVRWSGDGDPTVGAGAAREADALNSLYDENRRIFKRRVKIALLAGVAVEDIPLELRSSIQRFRIPSPDMPGVEALVRTLTGQPLWERPPVGPLPVLDPYRRTTATGEPAIGGGGEAQRALRQKLSRVEDELAAARPDEERGERLANDRLAAQGVLEVVERREHQGETGLAARRGAWNQDFRVPHDATVTGIAFNSDRSLLATGSSDKSAQIWSVADRERVRRLPHDARVNAVRFSPADDRLAVAAGSVVHMWPLEGEAHLLAHDRAVLRLAMSPEGRLLATLQEYEADARETLHLWDLDQHQQIPLPRSAESVSGIAFSPDGLLLATTSFHQREGTQLWKLADHDEYRRLNEADELTTRPMFSPGGTLIASASSRGQAWIWDIASSRYRFFDHDSPLLEPTFSPDGRMLATVRSDQEVDIWLVAEDEPHARLPHKGCGVLGLAFTPDSRLLATACSDNCARVWDIEENELQDSVSHPDSVSRVAFGADADTLATVCADYSARVWTRTGA